MLDIMKHLESNMKHMEKNLFASNLIINQEYYSLQVIDPEILFKSNI